MTPIASLVVMWSAKAPVGAGSAAASRPSSSMNRAPWKPSSPGWNMQDDAAAQRLPALEQQAGAAEQHRDVGVVAARVHRARGPPTRTRGRCPPGRGRPSMSARSRTVGPGSAPSITATTEPTAEPSAGASPRARTCAATSACVRGSARPVSGCRWRRRRTSTRSGRIAWASARREGRGSRSCPSMKAQPSAKAPAHPAARRPRRPPQPRQPPAAARASAQRAASALPGVSRPPSAPPPRRRAPSPRGRRGAGRRPSGARTRFARPTGAAGSPGRPTCRPRSRPAAPPPGPWSP